MRIAVTGGTGFLGRYIVRELSASGHSLRCWYREKSRIDGLESLPNVEWIKGTLGEETAPLLEGADAVVHGALYRPEGFNFRDAASAPNFFETFLEINLMGSLRLMEAARAQGCQRFLYISSCAVHEKILGDRPLDETHPTWSTTHYGAHKAAVENFVTSFGLGQNWPICALRPSGIYGAAHPIAKSKYYELVQRVKRGDAIDAPSGGKEVHAHDVARAADLLLKVPAEKIVGQAFNCCDRYIAEEEVARIAKELTGSASTVSDHNKGPKNQIDTSKLCGLGFEFGGELRLRATVKELVDHSP